MRTRIWPALAAAALFTLAGCATTRVTSAWHDPSAQTAALNKILVVAMVPSEAVRRNFEQRLTTELVKAGSSAVPSYRYVEDDKQWTAEKLKDLAAREGFDGVLIARYAGTETESVFTPTTYYDYVGWSSRYLYGPGYYETYEIVNLDTRLFDVKQGGKLIWAAVSETIDSDNVESHNRHVAEKIVQRLDHDLSI